MSEYVRHEETAGAIRLRIIADSDPMNPRTDFDHAAVMCCDHRRYNLGDEGAHDTVRDMIYASRDYRETWDDEDAKAYVDMSDGPGLWEAVQRCSDIVALPCYLYDHSGITMSTGRFSCPWDSGQVGFIAISKAKILEAWCKPAGSRLTKALREKAESLLVGEVKEYDQYLTGDVYGYVVDLVNGDNLPDDASDSCWGFFGGEFAEEEGKSALAYAVKKFPDLAALDSDPDDEDTEAALMKLKGWVKA